MKALRLYDRMGLLTPADVDPQTSYRRYRQSQFPTARLVVMLRRLDMPLQQVAAIVSASNMQAIELLESYQDQFERRVAGQRGLMAHIRSKLSGDDGGFESPDAKVRDVPEQLVLTEQRHVQVGAAAVVDRRRDEAPDDLGRRIRRPWCGRMGLLARIRPRSLAPRSVLSGFRIGRAGR